MDLKGYQKALERFVEERNWEAHQSPKNLAMALNVEAGELLEIFQWMTQEESSKLKQKPEILQHVKEELSDILSYTAYIAHVLGIDLEAAAFEKLEQNERKYPKPS